MAHNTAARIVEGTSVPVSGRTSAPSDAGGQRLWQLVASDGSITRLSAIPTTTPRPVASVAPLPSPATRNVAGMPRATTSIDEILRRPKKPAAPPADAFGPTAIRPAGNAQPTNPQLAQVIQLWSELSPPVQRAVVAMVKSAIAVKDQGTPAPETGPLARAEAETLDVLAGLRALSAPQSKPHG